MKNRKAFILLFPAIAVSGFAKGITILSIPWYFAKRGVIPDFNLVNAFVTFFTLFWGVYCGTLIDKFNRKHVFLVNNTVSCIIMFAAAAYGFSGHYFSFNLLVLIFSLIILGFNIHFPNLYAFAQEITEPGYYTRITSYIEIVNQFTTVISGAVAALLLEGVHVDKQMRLFSFKQHVVVNIDKWTLQDIFLMDACTYIIAITLIALITYEPVRIIQRERGSIKSRLRTGFNFLWYHKSVMIFGVFSFTVFAVTLVSLHNVMPMYVNNHLQAGAGVFGIGKFYNGAGSLIAGFLVSKLFERFKIPKSVIVLTFVNMFAMIVAFLSKNPLIFYALSFFIGFSNAGTRVMRLSYIFKHVPNELVGRVNSIFQMSNILIRTFFLLIVSSGFFNVGGNVVYAYAMMAAFTMISGFVLIWHYKRFVT